MGYNITRFKRKKLPPRQKHPLECPERQNVSWSMDFMSDSLNDGRRIRILNIIDDYNREALSIEIRSSICSKDVIEELMRLKDWRGLPEQIRVDNGPEFISKQMVHFCRQNGVELLHIQPGKPTQNAYIEQFNGSFRREVLNQNVFHYMQEARLKAEDWRIYYNSERPHKALKYASPWDLIE
jgi:putative transposase